MTRRGKGKNKRVAPQFKPWVLPCRFTVFFDGCCEPKNPGGNAGFGCIIMDGQAKAFEHSGFIAAAPDTSNNLAEYLAFNCALDWLVEHNFCEESIQCFGDSKLVIEQMFGSWRIHGVDTPDKPPGRYADSAVRARDLLKNFKRITGSWIPREENSLADDISKRELRERGVEFRIQPE